MQDENERDKKKSKYTVSASSDEIRDFLKIKMAKELNSAVDVIDTSLPWGTYGIDSLKIFEVIGETEIQFETEIPEEALYLCNNIDDLSRLVSENKHIEFIEE
jgi:acyl carrier protein